MSEKDKNNVEKLPKPLEKVIWLGIALVCAVAACTLKALVSVPSWLGVILSLGLMATIVIAAQKVSAERAAAAEDKENKIKYALKTALYYLYIFIAVIFVFLSLWLVGIVSF